MSLYGVPTYRLGKPGDFEIEQVNIGKLERVQQILRKYLGLRL